MENNYAVLTNAVGRDAFETRDATGESVASGMLDRLTYHVLPSGVAVVRPRLFVGFPGTGKTTLGYLLGRLLGRPVYPFNCSELSMSTDLLGSNQADPFELQPLRFVPGPALTAMGRGLLNPHDGTRPAPGILLVNDAHLAVNADVVGALMTVLDAERGSMLLPSGEIFQVPGPDVCRIIVTANGTVDAFPEALRSRLGGSIMINSPSRAQYRRLTQQVLRKVCYADYGNANGPTLSYRHYLTISELWDSCGLAVGVMTACDHDAKRAASVLQIMATNGCQEAGALVSEIAKGAPSGAPGSV